MKKQKKEKVAQISKEFFEEKWQHVKFIENSKGEVVDIIPFNE